MYNSKTGSGIAAQMSMHKKGSAGVHVPGANGSRTTYNKNRARRGVRTMARLALE